MAEKKKNFRRRLIILCAATALLFAAAGGFYAYRKHRIYKQFMAWRAEGMDAAAKNDGPRAVDHLTRYLVRYGNDVPALREYRRCVALVGSKDGKHISDQIRVLRHILRLEPALIDERRALMNLYAQTGVFAAEAYDAAQQILAVDPNDVDALGVHTRQLMRDKKTAEALKSSEKWRGLAPLSLDAQLVHVLLLNQADTPEEEILKHVNDLLKEHPDDPAFEIVAAIGHGTGCPATDQRGMPRPSTGCTSGAVEGN